MASETRERDAKPQLVEIGPRFVMNIVRVFDGAFRDARCTKIPVLDRPTQFGAKKMRPAGSGTRRKKEEARKEKKDEKNEKSVPKDPLDGIFK